MNPARATPEAGTPVDIRRLRTIFIVNPVCGRAATRARRRRQLEQFIARHRLTARLAPTTHAGHATELARAAVADGAELVVSVGGDGTMNEVASVLVGTDTCYGIVPAGSGNGLGRDLGLPMAVDRALDVLLAGAVRTIDTGIANGRPFFNVMGFGFDAEIGRRFNTCERRGFFNYLRIALRAFFTFRKQRLTVTTERGETFTLDAFLASVANSTQYGNNARIAPRARLDDGALDFVAITSGNALVALVLAVRMFTRSLDRSRFVRSATAARFRIHRDAPGPIHTDGEIHDAPAEFDVEVRPHSLRVVVPRPSGA